MKAAETVLDPNKKYELSFRTYDDDSCITMCYVPHSVSLKKVPSLQDVGIRLRLNTDSAVYQLWIADQSFFLVSLL